MLNFSHAIILGIVEGITEFLPISSTAHLILVSDFLKINQTDFAKSFEIIIQLGAILAVVVLFWKELFNLEIIKKLLVAFLPTGIIGLIFYKIIKQYLLGNTNIILVSLFLGGIFLIIFEKYFKEKEEEKNLKQITYTQCFTLGIFQSIAMIPGISRSAATIVGGLFLGIPRTTIVKFSFLLAVPTMLAATGLDIIKNANSFSINQIEFLSVGFFVSFFIAIISIRWLLGYIKNHSFTIFGIYRIILVILILI